MTDRIMLIGGPDSGKTNYLGRLWQKLKAADGDLTAPTPPKDIAYVEETLSHLLQGKFAPRSNKNIEQGGRDFHVSVARSGSTRSVELVVPDVTGELWKAAVERTELPVEWMEQLHESSGALLFIRVLSPLNVEPLDWVTSQKLLAHSADGYDPEQAYKIPTQVALCELLRFIEIAVGKNAATVARVAVVITAWDLLDEETAEEGPSAFLRKQFPLFAGRLSDTKLDVRVFGMSILGGDLADEKFKQEYLDGELSSAGFAVWGGDTDQLERTSDVSAPVAWVVEGVIAE